MKLAKSVKAWDSVEFAQTFKQEIRQLDRALLPLQAGLTQSSYVSDSEIDVVILHSEESAQEITVKAAIMFSGIIAGSCCSDDPTPMCEQNEYCELLFTIDKISTVATVSLL
jgi:hypothetical protein